MTFAFVNPFWDDYCNSEELPEVFSDLIAAGLPFTITALPQQQDDEPGTPVDGIECLTAAERNPSLCR
jgi:hypothetical protein